MKQAIDHDYVQSKFQTKLEEIDKAFKNFDPTKEIKEIADSFKSEYKNLIQKWNNLQHKYESMALWIKSFSEVSARFNEELANT